jgi:hypothetical protein
MRSATGSAVRFVQVRRSSAQLVIYASYGFAAASWMLHVVGSVAPSLAAFVEMNAREPAAPTAVRAMKDRRVMSVDLSDSSRSGSHAIVLGAHPVGSANVGIYTWARISAALSDRRTAAYGPGRTRHPHEVTRLREYLVVDKSRSNLIRLERLLRGRTQPSLRRDSQRSEIACFKGGLGYHKRASGPPSGLEFFDHPAPRSRLDSLLLRQCRQGLSPGSRGGDLRPLRSRFWLSKARPCNRDP